MEQQESTITELKQISPSLADIEKKNPFLIPDGYFFEFPEMILSIIRQNNLLSSIEEIESISPLLASLKSKQTYTVPTNYFDQFSISVMQQESQKENDRVSAPVHSMANSKKWIRYAAAAVLVGLIGLVSLFFLNNSGQISGDNIIKNKDLSLNHPNNPSVEDLKDLSDDALYKYLAEMPEESKETDSAASAIFNLALLNVDDNGLAELLHEIPDEDLKKFTDDNNDYLSL